ncbi:kinetochore protein NUF2 homolog isoform X2 [Magnolia sinica]|uniref:kinetochore protein NUF2 homolog isoform X2 n=1 Tax=Magnolia sinica TaxID=86752 RepID=UPI00265B624A|nr:kinetochore protein NUF2 homolog isoform X2 [Magnolia sinica]
MSSYSFPVLSLSEIVSFFSQLQIATVKPEDLANPTVDFMTSLYTAILTHLDPLGDDPAHADFATLELLEDPDRHVYSVRIVNLYHKMKDLVNSACSMNFTLKDLVSPKRDRTTAFISGIINLCLYNQDKLSTLQPIMEKLDGYEQQRLELEAHIAKLKEEIVDHEEASRLEQPKVQEVEAEVKELRQNIQVLNKQQVSLKSSFRTLKDKNLEINDKRALEEKKSIRTELTNSERSAMQCFQERNSTVEVYSKAHKKMSKRLAQMQALQEQVNSAKTIDKDVKDLKANLSNEAVSDMSLEAKIVDRQGKLDKLEESRKAMEKERDLKHAEAVKELNAAKSEMELKSHELDQRERKVEVMVAEGDDINMRISSVKESGVVTRQQLADKCEEIVAEVRVYSDSISPLLGRIENLEMEVDETKGMMLGGLPHQPMKEAVSFASIPNR